MRSAIAACVLVLATACSSSTPATPSPTPTSSPAPAATPRPTEVAPATPTTSPVAAPPELGTPFPLAPLEVETRLVPDGAPEGVGVPFIVNFATLEAHRWSGVAIVAPSPFDDRVLGVVYGESSEPDRTVLLDLSTGELEGILPVGASVLQWPEADRLFLLIDPLKFGRPRSWPAGIYELDLAARTIDSSLAVVAAACSRPTAR